MLGRFRTDYTPLERADFEPVVKGRRLGKLAKGFRYAERWLNELPPIDERTDLGRARRELEAAGKLCSQHFVGDFFGDPPPTEAQVKAVGGLTLSALDHAPGHPGVYYDAVLRLLVSVMPNSPKPLHGVVMDQVERVRVRWPAMFWSTHMTIMSEKESMKSMDMAQNYRDHGSAKGRTLALRAVNACPLNEHAWFQVRYQLGVQGKFPKQVEALEERLRTVDRGNADQITWLYDHAKDRAREVPSETNPSKGSGFYRGRPKSVT